MILYTKLVLPSGKCPLAELNKLGQDNWRWFRAEPGPKFTTHYFLRELPTHKPWEPFPPEVQPERKT